jgi:hypothetical protein
MMMGWKYLLAQLDNGSENMVMHHTGEDLGLVSPSINLRDFGFNHISM